MFSLSQEKSSGTGFPVRMEAMAQCDPPLSLEQKRLIKSPSGLALVSSSSSFSCFTAFSRQWFSSVSDTGFNR